MKSFSLGNQIVIPCFLSIIIKTFLERIKHFQRIFYVFMQ